MEISKFYMQICNNLTVFNTNFNVKKCNAFFAWLISKIDVSMELIKTTKKSLKFLLTIVQIKNIVNISKPHQGCNSWISRKAVSIFFLRKHAYGGANLVPVAVPEICYLICLLNLKQLFFRTKSAILISSLVGIVCYSLL